MRENKLSREEVRAKPNKKRLSMGVTIVAIIMFVFGINDLSSFLGSRALGSLIWGILYMVSVIGILKQKFWGLRVAQATFILSLLVSPLILLAFEVDLIIRVIFFLGYVGFFTFFLWYLTGKHVVRQFVEIESNDRNREKNEYLELKQESKELQDDFEKKCSLRPVFIGIITGAGLILWYGGQIILLLAMIYYFLEWWGRWAILLIVGGFIGIPFIGSIFGIMTFAPVFPIIFWLYTGTFPLWYFVIWGISFLGMIVFSYLIPDY